MQETLTQGNSKIQATLCQIRGNLKEIVPTDVKTGIVIFYSHFQATQPYRECYEEKGSTVQRQKGKPSAVLKDWRARFFILRSIRSLQFLEFVPSGLPRIRTKPCWVTNCAATKRHASTRFGKRSAKKPFHIRFSGVSQNILFGLVKARCYDFGTHLMPDTFLHCEGFWELSLVSEIIFQTNKMKWIWIIDWGNRKKKRLTVSNETRIILINIYSNLYFFIWSV